MRTQARPPKLPHESGKFFLNGVEANDRSGGVGNGIGMSMESKMDYMKNKRTARMEEAPPNHAVNHDAIALLDRLMERLSLAQKEVFLMRAEGLTFREISDLLGGVAMTTIRSRYYQSLVVMRRTDEEYKRRTSAKPVPRPLYKKKRKFADERARAARAAWALKADGFTVAETALLLGVSETTVDNLLMEGKSGYLRLQSFRATKGLELLQKEGIAA